MKIALGVCGGIAAYKAAEVVRLLQDHGIRVQVIMTASAQEFIRPLTFAALSGEKVITSMFDRDAGAEPNIDSAIEHIAVAQSIDALVVAPAMNVNMCDHPATQQNLEILRKRGVTIVDPGSGYLACGMTGPGRLAE